MLGKPSVTVAVLAPSRMLNCRLETVIVEFSPYAFACRYGLAVTSLGLV
jgi:hypothetical protein